MKKLLLLGVSSVLLSGCNVFSGSDSGELRLIDRPLAFVEVVEKLFAVEDPLASEPFEIDEVVITDSDFDENQLSGLLPQE